MKKVFVNLNIFVLFILGFTAVANAYTWQMYEGHGYALTDGWNNWSNAEEEAVAAGGHLVTINDDAENDWLAETFNNAYSILGTEDESPWQAAAWIGYNYNSANSNWEWVSEDPVTYYNHDFWNWSQASGTHAYLHTSVHGAGGYDWNANPLHDTNPLYYLQGIIEISLTPEEGNPVVVNPEPATIALLGIGLAGLVGVAARRKWKVKVLNKR